MWHTFADTSSSVVDHARLECTHGSHATVPHPHEGKGCATGAIEFLWPISLILILLMISISLHAFPVGFHSCHIWLLLRDKTHVAACQFAFLPPPPRSLSSLSVCCMLMRAFLSAITISSSWVRGPQRSPRLALQTRSISISGPKRVTMQCEMSHGFTFFSPCFFPNLRGWATSIRHQSHIDQLSSTIY